MNKGLGKLILIAGLGLGALYFLGSDSKKVSNSEVKKETKEHPSLDKETIETIVKDHKEEKKEEPKKVHRNKMTKEEFLEKIDDKKLKLFGSLEKTEQELHNGNKIKIYLVTYKHPNGDFVTQKFSNIKAVKKYIKEMNIIVKRVLSEETKQRLREQLAKGRAKQKAQKMSKAEAGKLGGEATADLGKHKGHKSKKGLRQDQKLVSKEEHEKHYQKGRFDKNGWVQISKMQFENLDNKERIILEFKFDTETFDVKLYKQGTIKVLANFLSYKKAIEEAKKYIESQKESLKLKIKVGDKWEDAYDKK